MAAIIAFSVWCCNTSCRSVYTVQRWHNLQQSLSKVDSEFYFRQWMLQLVFQKNINGIARQVAPCIRTCTIILLVSKRWSLLDSTSLSELDEPFLFKSFSIDISWKSFVNLFELVLDLNCCASLEAVFGFSCFFIFGFSVPRTWEKEWQAL
jgi:hypothetical protein